jgi:hypothetical protein
MAGKHETSDANIRNLALSGVGLFAVIGLSLLAMWVMFRYLAGHEKTGPPAPLMARERVVPPAPQLQVAPASDLERVRQAEAAVLNSYAWVDRKQGVVRIPVDRAIELLAGRGLPARTQ